MAVVQAEGDQGLRTRAEEDAESGRAAKGKAREEYFQFMRWDSHLIRPLPDLAVVADPGEVEVGNVPGLVREGQEALRVD